MAHFGEVPCTSPFFLLKHSKGATFRCTIVLVQLATELTKITKMPFHFTQSLVYLHENQSRRNGGVSRNTATYFAGVQPKRHNFVLFMSSVVKNDDPKNGNDR